jgi:hypothetical protein
VTKRTHEIVVVFFLHIMTDDNFELCTEDDTKPITADGLFSVGGTASLSPLVELAAKSVCF